MTFICGLSTISVYSSKNAKKKNKILISTVDRTVNIVGLVIDKINKVIDANTIR
jgi:hypothetical protein